MVQLNIALDGSFFEARDTKPILDFGCTLITFPLNVTSENVIHHQSLSKLSVGDFHNSTGCEWFLKTLCIQDHETPSKKYSYFYETTIPIIEKLVNGEHVCTFDNNRWVMPKNHVAKMVGQVNEEEFMRYLVACGALNSEIGHEFSRIADAFCFGGNQTRLIVWGTV